MAPRHRHSFPRAFLSASLVALLSSQVAASGVSTSVFPNSACSGASASAGGLVGIGKVTLSTGEVETHCGCPSDNLPAFDACPISSSGESVCNSILDLDTGAFTASCGIVSCIGSDCPSTVVNTVVVDGDDCLFSGKGALGFISIDGEAKCACSSEGSEFTECPTPENGSASCIAIDGDFLGMSVAHKETVACGIVCDEGFVLSSAGVCQSLTKRNADAPVRHGPSGSHRPSASKSHHHSASHTPSGGPSHLHHSRAPAPTRHHGVSHSHASYHSHRPSYGGPSHSIPIKVAPTPAPGASQYHNHHHGASSSYSSSSSLYTPTRPHPSKGPSKGPSASLPSASAAARMKARAVEEFVFSTSTDVCASDERSCSTGLYDFSCVRLDDVTECGGCHADGNAVNCLELPGIQSASCLKGGCVVRACSSGFVQTSEGTCSPKA
ncbi:hypothetical protein RQP46_000734 [Phenoliferia psychrophenolica]